MDSIRCERCGSNEVRRDQVWGDECLSLGECLRCELRWTQPLRRAPRRVEDHSVRAVAAGAETIAA